MARNLVTLIALAIAGCGGSPSIEPNDASSAPPDLAVTHESDGGDLATPDALPASDADAGVIVTAVSGVLNHKGSVTISGSGFGNKSSAAPVVFDDASGTSLSDKWDYASPFTNDAAFRIGYRTPAQITLENDVMGGIALPHSHDTKYISGAHYSSTTVDANSGFDVVAGKNNQQGQLYTYISYYRAIDPHWYLNTGCATTSDPHCNHNFKEYDYAQGDGAYGNGPNIYLDTGAGSNPLSASIVWGGNYIEGMDSKIYSVNTAFMNWYQNVNTVYSDVLVAGPGVGWQKVELILKHDSADGFHRVYQDNKIVWEINLDDDGLPAGPRSETPIGGYAVEYGSAEVYKNNWRYYADVYYDHSLARVLLANNVDYDDATIIEPQIPSSWSDESVNVTVNLGKLTQGETAYVFVFDAANEHNAKGFPVTIGQ